MHIDAVCALKSAKNGTTLELKNNVCAVKEYQKIVIYKSLNATSTELPFSLGNLTFAKYQLNVQAVNSQVDLKDGFYADFDKIPTSAIIRTKKDGDKFTKFGGGSKSLGDFLTDKKVPLRIRNNLPLVADGKEILFIFGIAISDKIKVTKNTEKIIKFTIEENYEQKF